MNAQSVEDLIDDLYLDSMKAIERLPSLTLSLYLHSIRLRSFQIFQCQIYNLETSFI